MMAIFNMTMACSLLALAQGPAPLESIRKPFDYGALEAWIPVFGQWQAGTGVLKVIACQEGGGHLRSSGSADGALSSGAIILCGKPRWQDVRLRIRLASGTDVPNCLLRVRDMENYIQFGRYGGKIVLVVFQNGRAITVAQTDRPFSFPVTLQAEITGSLFRGSCDGVLAIEHSFSEGEIPSRGRIGLQANHPNAIFDEFEADAYRMEAMPGSGQVDIQSLSVTEGVCGLNKVSARISIPEGLDAGGDAFISACSLNEGQRIPLALVPPTLVARISATEGLWEGDLFTLCEGQHDVSISVYNLDNVRFEKSVQVPIVAKGETFSTCHQEKLFDFVDPHPVWRGLVDHSIGFRETEESFSNALWDMTWTPQGLSCRAMTLSPVTGDPKSAQWRMSPSPFPILAFPRVKNAAGEPLQGPIWRELSPPSSLFCVRPSHRIIGAWGELQWRTEVWQGGPILRWEGEFKAQEDGEIVPEVVIKHPTQPLSFWLPLASSAASGSMWTRKDFSLSEGFDLLTAKDPLADNYILWRVASAERPSPLLLYAFNRKPTSMSWDPASGWTIRFHEVPTRQGESLTLPAFCLILADASPKEMAPESQSEFVEGLAHASLGAPLPDAHFRDVGDRGDGVFHVSLDREYAFSNNDWMIQDEGQLIPVPWCAGAHTVPEPAWWIHTAFGNRPLVQTRKSHVDLLFPMPKIAMDLVAPDYEPLTGDWLGVAEECIAQLIARQNPDGTFRGYERMDHYSLGRMTLGLMVAYGGLRSRPDLQEKLSGMVRLALDRMLGESQSSLQDDMSVDKGFSTGVDAVRWRQGEAYEPFAYHPKWDVHTEMRSLVDQNLGHAHLFFSLLLYGHYVDLEYLRRPSVQQKIRELIKFQWLSQDWNGDIWRVYVEGVDAAGGGDGFEEDLALILPRLAEEACLEEGWIALSNRISAMKYGALMEFDYLPRNNEWGYDFLTPMHHPKEWVPEGGWTPIYAGDVWWTGPSVCAGVYGPWYVDSVYVPKIETFTHQWYDLLDEVRDVASMDDRHWLLVGGYCSEARLFDPFLGAAKLMRSLDVAQKLDFLTEKTEGEAIWNFAFAPAAMTMIHREILSNFRFMKGFEPVTAGVISPDPEHCPSMAWKGVDEAVVTVAGQRIGSRQMVDLKLNMKELGLEPAACTARDLSDETRTIPVSPGGELRLLVQPRSATTVVIRQP